MFRPTAVQFRGLLGIQLLDALPFGIGEAFPQRHRGAARLLAGSLRNSAREGDINGSHRVRISETDSSTDSGMRFSHSARQFKRRNGLFASDRGKIVKEYVERISGLEVVV